MAKKRKREPMVMMRENDCVVWAFADEPLHDATRTKILDGPCPFCGKVAITSLPPRLLARETDGTTHLCHPLLDGCNHGFAEVV